MIDSADILKGKILIVDDLEANVVLLERLLRGAGYNAVTSTLDSRTVCALHRLNSYDLIILDLEMPGMDGFEVLEALKETEKEGYVPVLVVTAQPDQMLRALKAGAKDFISKPFDLAEVLTRVRNMLEVRLYAGALKQTARELRASSSPGYVAPTEPLAPTDPHIGSIVKGRYTVLQRIGVGGMGVVYKALQHELDRHVALKVLSPAFSSDPSAAERFRIEARAASQLTNGHTVVVHDFGAMDNGALFIAMQLLEGESLHNRIERGAIPARTALTIAMDVCESLEEAHERNPPIIHRDIKPDNIFVRDDSGGEPHATVLDFGLARFADSQRSRLTASNIVMGTAKYMSPEQCRSDPETDARADLYALGIVLFEMLTGRPPFEAPDTVTLLLKQTTDLPPAIEEVSPGLVIPSPLRDLVYQLLEKVPANRPQSARAVRERLRAIRDQLPKPWTDGLSVDVDVSTFVRRISVPDARPPPSPPAPANRGRSAPTVQQRPNAAARARNSMSMTWTRMNSTRPRTLGFVCLLIAITVMGFLSVDWQTAKRGKPDQPSQASGASAEIIKH